jgi:plastocyanin
MRSTSMLVLTAAVVGLIAVACGGSAPRSSFAGSVTPSVATPTPTAKTDSAPVDPRKDGLEVGFGEFAITLEAKTIRPGPVTFVVHNGGKLVHGFEMKQEDEGGHSGLGGGDDRFKVEAPRFGPDDTIRIKANLPEGVYEIECYVANHEALGMRTTLVVKKGAPLVRPTQAAAGTVAIRGFAFDPGRISVKSGTKVTWKNEDPAAHTVTAKDGSFDSKPLPSGKAFVVTFGSAGSFSYHCAIHPTMTGTVNVTA